MPSIASAEPSTPNTPIKMTWTMALVIFFAGVISATAVTCSLVPSGETKIVTAPLDTASVVLPLLPGIVRYDSVERVSVRVDTLRTQYTVYVHDTIHDALSTSNPYAASPIKPGGALGGLLPAAASVLIAAFRPATPRNFIEVWADAGHDFVGGGYGGRLELDLNLDQIHLANVTAYLAAMIWHGFEVVLGIRGKLWGMW